MEALRVLDAEDAAWGGMGQGPKRLRGPLEKGNGNRSGVGRERLEPMADQKVCRYTKEDWKTKHEQNPMFSLLPSIRKAGRLCSGAGVVNAEG